MSSTKCWSSHHELQSRGHGTKPNKNNLWLIHVEVWQKITKICKAIILQKIIKTKKTQTLSQIGEKVSLFCEHMSHSCKHLVSDTYSGLGNPLQYSCLENSMDRAAWKATVYGVLKSWTGGGNGNPLQYSCLENPMDRGAWQATVYGVARIRHDCATKHTHSG